MFVNRTRGVVAATLGVLGLGACTDPAQNTDLRPDGPPDVLAVLVLTDASSQLVEQATFCKVDDEKRPSVVGLPDFTQQQVCPADRTEAADEVSNGYPDGWYVRIMFDELLDGDIEKLTPVIDPDTGEATGQSKGSVASTHPVTLQCESIAGGMVNVDYDGYYSPAGNRVTWPLGPSLVIKPNDPKLIATNTECQVTINANVVDKAGTPVDMDQRGPYKFKVAPIQVIAIDPGDDPELDDPIPATQIWFDNMYVQFNTKVDPASFCDEGTAMDECEFAFDPAIGTCSTGGEYCHVGGAACPTPTDTCAPAGVYAYSLAPFGFTPAEFGFGPTGVAKTEQNYSFSFLAGTKIKDRCGRETTFGTPSVDDLTLVHFATDKFKFTSATIASGETATPLKKLKLTYTNVLKGGDGSPGTAFPTSSIPTSAWTLTPLPFANDGVTQLTQAQTQVVAPDASGQIFFRGNFKLDTEYTFTLAAGTVITDAWGATTTQTDERKITWKTQAALAITSATATGATVTKATPTSSAGVSFGFNQNMVPTSLDATDYTFTTAAGVAVALDATTVTGCSSTDTSCTLAVKKAALAPGDYKFTLKKGATINDVFGNTYTQAADRVIEITVVEAAAPIQCL